MRRFVPYVRTAEGYVERISFAIYNSPYNVLYPYIYEERLVGWPERKVFWAAKSGPSVGLAPIFSYTPVRARRSPARFRPPARCIPANPQRAKELNKIVPRARLFDAIETE